MTFKELRALTVANEILISIEGDWQTVSPRLGDVADHLLEGGTVAVRERPDETVLELLPLPNSL